MCEGQDSVCVCVGQDREGDAEEKKHEERPLLFFLILFKFHQTVASGDQHSHKSKEINLISCCDT